MERLGGAGSSAVVKKAKEESKQKQENEQEFEVIKFTVRPRNEVKFEVGTIDNEFMGKKKSKVCCIFNKGHTLDSSSSSDEDCCGDEPGNAKDANRYDRYPKHQRRAMRDKKNHD